MRQFLIIIIAGVGALAARADTVVLGTVGPTGNYNALAGPPVFAGLPTPNREIGVRFVSPVNGSISRVELPFTYYDNFAGIPLAPGAVNVFLYGDKDGGPDNANQTLLGSVSPSTPVGGPVTNLLSLDVSVSVVAGVTYWLVIKPAEPVMAGVWNWKDLYYGDPYYFGPYAYPATAASADDSGWSVCEFCDPVAFRITATGSYAPIVISDNPAAVISVNDGTPGSFGGFSFSANRPIKITDVGVWDENGDGLMENIDVSLSISAEVYILLGGAVIPAGTIAPLRNGFRYVPLSAPITVGGGSVSIGSRSQNGLDLIAAGLVKAAPEVRVTSGHFGPNFLFTTKLIVNGDFERGSLDTTGNVYAWTVSGNVAITTEGGTLGSQSAALSFGGDSQGNTISQGVVTLPNQRYDVDFDAAVYGKRTGLPLQLNALVHSRATLLNETVTPPDVSTFEPAHVQFQHCHFSFIADSDFATLQFSDIGDGNANADILIDAVSVAETPPPYSAWQALYFTQAQRNNLSVSGWDADPDGDGIPNSLEFYFNLDPLGPMTVADAGALPHITNINPPRTPGELPSDITLVYRRRIGVNASIDSSVFLQDWSPAEYGATSVATGDGDGVTEMRTVHVGADGGFYRLTFSPPEHPSSASQWSSSGGGNDHWYEVVQQPLLTWQQARDYAVDRGGYLATITSAAENDFIKSLVGNGANPVVGAYKDNIGWHWVTAEPFTFTNWDAGEPNNSGGQEDCLQFLGPTGTWNDTQSTYINAFVVEYPN